MPDLRITFIGHSYDVTLDDPMPTLKPLARAPQAPLDLANVVANACDNVKRDQLYSPTRFGYVAAVVDALSFMDAVSLLTETEQPFNESVIY